MKLLIIWYNYWCGQFSRTETTLDDLMPHLAETFGDDVDEWEHREGIYLADWVAAELKRHGGCRLEHDGYEATIVKLS